MLEVEGLSVAFRTPHGLVRAVNDVDVSLRKGEPLVVIGESGSGKTVLAHAMLRLLPRNVDVTGSVRLDGRDLLRLSEREMRKVRGRHISLIPQSPGAALNPVRQLGPLLMEIARARGLTKGDARKALDAILAEMDLDFETIHSMYAHQLSGGMQQRVVNSLALLGRPDVVLADEPTFGLDADLVSITAQQLRRIVENGSALLVITHDLTLAEQLGGHIALLYAGRIVEYRDTAGFFAGPAHPYGRGLLAARPDHGGLPIPGLPPELTALPLHCSFAGRCPDQIEDCTEKTPGMYPIGRDSGLVRCLLHAAR